MNLENLVKTRELLCDIRDGKRDFGFDYTTTFYMTNKPCGCVIGAARWAFGDLEGVSVRDFFGLTRPQTYFLVGGGRYKHFIARPLSDMDIHDAIKRIEFLIAEAKYEQSTKNIVNAIINSYVPEMEVEIA